MAIPFPQPTHLPCPQCGAAVAQAAETDHVCDPDRLVDFQMLQLRDELNAVDDELAAYLDSPRGRFELWCARREREDTGQE